MASAAHRHLLLEIVETVLVALLLALFFRSHVLQAFRIPTGSMAPGLSQGDHLLVNKVIFDAVPRWLQPMAALLPVRVPRRGDVVIFRSPEESHQDYVKRCVAVGGDTIALKDKQLLVNGRPVNEPWVQHVDPRVYPDAVFLDLFFRRRDNLPPQWVPPEHVFLLGDNRDLSRDSRLFGPVAVSRLRGRALLVYMSVTETAGREHLLLRLRWDRSLRVVR